MTLRDLQSRDLGDRIADVCPGCGQHMIMDTAARLKWILEGGEIRCGSCQITKTRTVEK